MICKIAAQSSAVRAIGPILSIVKHSAIAPVRGTRPYVGRNPLTLQNAAGTVIDPHVSVPMAKPTMPSPTAAPAPLLDPPAQRDTSNGHLHGPVIDAPGDEYPPPPASSIIASLATKTHPALVN